MSVAIPLSRGFEAIVSDEDAELALSRKWYAGTVDTTTTYAMRTERVDGVKKAVYLHRIVVGAKKGEIVDHANGNTLDNRRENLRIATPQQNCANRRGYRPASGYRGVYKCKGRWRAEITVNRQPVRGGSFESATDAARRYDELALKHFGVFAVLNFPAEAQS